MIERSDGKGTGLANGVSGMDYEKMDKETLIAHCMAYGKALHMLANECFYWRNVAAKNGLPKYSDVIKVSFGEKTEKV